MSIGCVEWYWKYACVNITMICIKHRFTSYWSLFFLDFYHLSTIHLLILGYILPLTNYWWWLEVTTFLAIYVLYSLGNCSNQYTWFTFHMIYPIVNTNINDMTHILQIPCEQDDPVYPEHNAKCIIFCNMSLLWI